MTPEQKVRERYPQAELMPANAGVHDIVTRTSGKPSPGYRHSKCLGAGSTPELAWVDAAKRILRRKSPLTKRDGK